MCKLVLNNTGFVFSIEATISTMIFLLLLISLPTSKVVSLKEPAISEQANDLLRVWSTKTSNNEEMTFDAKHMFGETAEVWLNEKQILIAIRKNNSIATEGIILDDKLIENKIRIIVYYD